MAAPVCRCAANLADGGSDAWPAGWQPGRLRAAVAPRPPAAGWRSRPGRRCAARPWPAGWADHDLAYVVEFQSAVVEAAGPTDARRPDLQRGAHALATLELEAIRVGGHDPHPGTPRHAQPA